MKYVLPRSIETEQSVLSALLIDNRYIDQVADLIGASDFYKTAHQYIYQAILDLRRQKEPVDLVTLRNKLISQDLLEKCGGISYISEHIEAAPMPSNVMAYAKTVMEYSVRRKFIMAANNASNLAFDMTVPIDDVIENVHADMLKIDIDTDADSVSLSDAVYSTIERYEKLWHDKLAITGVTTGFTQIDLALSGMQPSDLIILAGRPSMGKTALALQFARGAAESGVVPLIFSLEQPFDQLMDRYFAAGTMMPTTAFRTGRWSESDWQKIVEAADGVLKTPVRIDDRGGLSYKEIRKAARRNMKKYNVGLIIIDHLQLVTGAGNKSRNDEIGIYTRQFKAMAKELKIPVLLLSQLSRKLEERGDKRPKLSDLRDSGNIEQDADVVAFIYRDDVYNTDENSPYKGLAEFRIAKQRQGPVCMVWLQWLSYCTMFKSKTDEGACDL